MVQTPKWKICRREIVKKVVHFPNFVNPDYLKPSITEPYFAPMERLNLNSVDENEEERLLLNDLFNIYAGWQTKNIRYELIGNSLSWTVNPSASENVRPLLNYEGCLPMAETIIRLQRYIDVLSTEISRGKTASALGTSCGRYLSEEVLECVKELQMELRRSGSTMKLLNVAIRMRPFIQPCGQLLSIVSTVVENEMVGGEILTVLNDHIKNCVSSSIRSLLLQIERFVTYHYLSFVYNWISNGTVLNDYCHEFMIWDLERTNAFCKADILGGEVASDYKNTIDDYEQKFCLIKPLCPSQLTDVLNDIVNCGNYVNIIAELNESTEFKKIGEDDNRMKNLKCFEDWQNKELEFIKKDIKMSCAFASEKLVSRLKTEFALEDTFRSIGELLLFEYSDWVDNFLDIADSLLSRPVSKIGKRKLEEQFEEAVSSSGLRNTKYRGLFRPVLERYDVFSFFRLIRNSQAAEEGIVEIGPSMQEEVRKVVLDGFGVFSVHMNVTSPLSLVFSPRIILMYELVFRTFFCFRRATRLLFSKQLCNDLARDERALIDNMLHILNVYVSHCTMDIIPTAWAKLTKNILKCTSLEDILLKQDSFLQDVNQMCLLVDIRVTNALSHIISIVTHFATDVIAYEEASIMWEEACSTLKDVLSNLAGYGDHINLLLRLFSHFY